MSISDTQLETPKVIPAGYQVPSHGKGLLKVGGNNGGGRPKSQVRDRAKRVYDLVLAEYEKLLEDHVKGSIKLSAGELSKIAAEVKTIGLGELKDMSLDKDTFLSRVTEMLSEFETDPQRSLQMYDWLVSRLKDE